MTIQRIKCPLKSLVCFFVCLFGFNIAFKHLRANRHGANVLPHRNAMLQTQDMTHLPRHSIQTQGRPVAVLSIDVEHHTRIHSYPF